MSDSSGRETTSKFGNCFFISLTTTSRCWASRLVSTNTFVTPRNSTGCPYSMIGVCAKTVEANVKTSRDNQPILPKDLFIEFHFLQVGLFPLFLNDHILLSCKRLITATPRRSRKSRLARRSDCSYINQRINPTSAPA